MLENATRICEAKFGMLVLREGDSFRSAALHNVPPALADFMKRGPVRPGPNVPISRMARTKQVVHVADIRMEQAYIDGDPVIVAGADLAGYRTILAVPMLKESELIGGILIFRQEVRPFTDKQIALVTNFASQAVIAIENARLLNELRQSLEQQTATADVLRVISSSPGELEPVFQAMLENAIRICDAKFGNLLRRDGDTFRLAAGVGVPPELAEFHRRHETFRPVPGSPLARAMQTKRVSHTADDAAEAMPSPPARLGGARSMVCVPMLKDDAVTGAIIIYRQEVSPFTDKQIELLTNFAAQAVIAIENTRLLNELRQRTADLTESLEQQTATSEVLSVISSSPGDLDPVFKTILENATRICGAEFGHLFRYEDGVFRVIAMHNTPPAFDQFLKEGPIIPAPGTGLARIVSDPRTTHILDVRKLEGYANRDPFVVAGAERGRVRTLLIVPMLKDAMLIGVIAVFRQEVRPFTDKQIALVTNFAAQAVIAIENTRLLKELRQSLEQQTATADVLRVISSSPGELEPVFQAMLESATRICEAKFVILYRFDGEAFHFAADVGTPREFADYLRRRGPHQPPPGTNIDVLLRTKEVVRITDDSASPAPGAAARIAGARSIVSVPMLKENVLIGAITIFRQEVRPFTDKQIELVTNFAAQAVIAIENARLLNELRQSLEQQTATADVLRVISSSPGEL